MPARILIVDDEAFQTLTLSTILTRAQYSVVSANTLWEAQTHLRSQVFDFVFLDLHLGGTNGLDLIPEISSAYPETKVIILAADAREDVISSALEKGAQAYLIKPLRPDAILGVLSDISHSTPLTESDHIRTNPPE